MPKLERLSRLADLLERDAEVTSRFDLTDWGTFETKRTGFLGLKKVSCNTTACAVGLACISGEFEADGLDYRVTRDNQLVPEYAGAANFAAVNRFFGLEQADSNYLFYVDSYEGATRGPAAAKAVSARLREFVAKHSSEEKHATTVADIKRRALEPASA